MLNYSTEIGFNTIIGVKSVYLMDTFYTYRKIMIFIVYTASIEVHVTK